MPLGHPWPHSPSQIRKQVSTHHHQHHPHYYYYYYYHSRHGHDDGYNDNDNSNSNNGGNKTRFLRARRAGDQSLRPDLPALLRLANRGRALADALRRGKRAREREARYAGRRSRGVAGHVCQWR